MLFGCRSCGFSNLTYDNQTISGLQCTDCDFGMYLLKISNSTSQSNTSNILQMCLPRCEDYSYQYVSNPNTRQCEYCGPYCTRCTLQNGCTDCYMDTHGYYLTTNNYTLAFPYNTVKQPSTQFQICQNCSVQYNVNGRCDACSKYNQTYCESCYGYVNGYNQTYEAFLGGCQLCTNNSFNNCMQCNTTNSSQCLVCNNGYYLNSTKQCQQCNITGCNRCDSATSCLECKNEFFYTQTSKTCSSCSVKNYTTWQYELQDYRCSQCNGTTTNASKQCAYCDIGYMYSLLNTSMPNTSCQLKCGVSQYPNVNFQSTVNNNDDLIKNTTCLNCSTSCYKCTGNNTNLCTECFVGQYLNITDSVRRTGTCINKTTPSTAPSFDIYVSNLATDIASNSSLRNGSQTYPLIDLDDAMVRGKELASQYTQTVTINIYLTSGSHYLLRDRGDSAQIYQPTQYYDPYNLNFIVNINPVGCLPALPCTASQVTIYNKRRDAFVLDVAVMLHMRSIIIDSLDSILPSSTGCLGERRTCCSVSSSLGVFNTLSNDTFSCTTAFDNLDLDLQCQVNMPRTLFRMRLNNQSQIIQPNTLFLENCQINNIFYDMNSVVNFTEYGGYVKLYGTKFQRISICGAILKNYYTGYPLADYTQLDSSSGFNAESISFLTKMRRIQQSYYDAYYNEMLRSPGSSPFTSCPLTNCFDIDIRGATFYGVPYELDYQSSLNVVSNDGGLRYQGSIINTVNFQGHINIQDSNFTENKFGFDGCEDMLSSMIQTPTAPTIKNNFDYLQLSNSNFNVYQLESLISIMNHTYKIFFYFNTFVNNIALKGIINIEVNRYNSATNYYPLLFYQNNFTGNAAIFDTNVLNLRVVNNYNLLGYSYTEKSDLGCGGVDINRNTFLNNYGCSQTDGAIFLYCFNQLQNSNTSIIQYVPSWDSQYFIGQSGNYSLAAGDKSQIPTDAFINIYWPYVFNNATPTVSISSNSNLQQTLFRNNIFINNNAGQNKQILDVQGFPVVQLRNDYYLKNMNWIPNAFRAYSIIFQQQQNQTLPLALGGALITRASLQSFQLKAQSISTLNRALYLNIRNTTYDSNYVSDSNTSDPTVKRSSAVFLLDFYGIMIINQTTIFQNNIGIRGIDSLNSLLSSDIQTGFRTSLINHFRCQFSAYLISDLKFINNIARFDTTLPGVPLPYLFIITQDLMSPTYSYLFDRVVVQNNTFYNAYGMIYIDIQNLLISNSQFTLNNKPNDTNNNGLLVIKLNDTYTISFQNNTFSNTYTNNMSIIYFENSAKQTASGGMQVYMEYYNNSFDTIITSSTGSPVIYIENNSTYQQVWTSNYSLALNFTNCTFKNIKGQADLGIINLASSYLLATYYSLFLYIQNVKISNLTQGHFLKIGDQQAQSSQNFKQTVIISQVNHTGSSNGNFLELGQLNGTLKSVNRTIMMQNNQFSNFNNGSVVHRNSQNLNSQSYYNNSIQLYNNTIMNLDNGGAINLEADVQILASTDISFIVLINNTQMTNIGLIAIKFSSQSFTGSANLMYLAYVFNSTFTNVTQNIFYIQSLNATSQGNVSMNMTFDSLRMLQIQRSPLRLGPTTIVASQGWINSQYLVQNTYFDNVANQNGAVAIYSRDFTSKLDLTQNFTVYNCRFSNYSSGNAILISSYNLNSTSQGVQEYYMISNSNFYNFTNGSSILIQQKYVTSQSDFQYQLTFFNLTLSLISNQSAIIIDPEVINSQGNSNRQLTFDTLNVTNALKEALYLSDQNIASKGQQNNYYTIRNSNFINIGDDSIQFGIQIKSASGVINDTLVLINTQMSKVQGSAVSFGVSQINTISSFIFTSIIYNCSFTDVAQNGYYIQSGGYVQATNQVNKSLTISSTTFNRIGLSAINLTTFNATSTNSQINSLIQITNSVVNSTQNSALYHGPRYLNSASTINSTTFLNNVSLSYANNNSIYFDLMTVNTTGLIILNYQLINSIIRHVTGYGMHNGGYLLNTSADMQIFLQAANSTQLNISNSGVFFGQIQQQGGNNFNISTDIINNTFTSINMNAFYLSSINATSLKGLYYLQTRVLQNTFLQINQNGVYIQSRYVNALGMINYTTLIQNNIFTTLGQSGINYLPQQLTSASQIIQLESLLSNTFQNIGQDAISLPQRLITTSTNYSHDLNVSVSTFKMIGRYGFNIGSLNLSSQNGYNKTISVLTNSFDTIASNAFQISPQSITNFQGMIMQKKTLRDQTQNQISSNGFYIGQIVFEAGTSQVFINTTNSRITASNIGINGFYKEPVYIRTKNSSSFSERYSSCIFQNISNSSVVNTLLNISASQIDSQMNFTNATIYNMTNGAGFDVGILNFSSITTGGYINNNITLQSSKINLLNGSQTSYGFAVGNITLISLGQLQDTRIFYNNSYANINLRGIFLNSSILQAKNNLYLNYSFTNSTYNNITTQSAIHVDNQTISSSNSTINRTISILSNIFNLIGKSSFNQLYLNIPSTSSDFQQNFTFFNNTVTKTGDSGVVQTNGDYLNINGTYYFNLIVDSCNFQNQGARGIYINTSTITTLGKVYYNSTITNSNFSNDQQSAISTQNFTYSSVGDIYENFIYQNLNISNMISSRGIFFNSRYLVSSGQIISSFSFSNLNFSNIQLSQGVDFLNQTILANKLIKFTYLFQKCLFQNILYGSGIRMTKNTLQSNDSINIQMNFHNSTFNNVNSVGDGSSLYINHEQCSAQNTHTFGLVMNLMNFKNIQQGGALKFRDYNSYSKLGHSFGVSLNQTTIDTVTSGVGIIIIKDTIQTADDYTSNLSILNNCKFNNIKSLNGDPAILLQEAYILSKTQYSSTIDIQDSTISNVQNGPALILQNDRIESSQNYINSITLKNVQFSNLAAADNSSISVSHSNTYAATSYAQSLIVTSCTFSSVKVGSTLRLYNFNLTSGTQQFSKNYDLSSTSFSGLQTNELAAVIVLDDQILQDQTKDVNEITFTKCTFTQNVGNLVSSSVYIDSNSAMLVTFSYCTFSNNNGIVTNEIYARTINTMTVNNSAWNSNTNNQNSAQFIYKDINDYLLIVQNSNFNCGITFNSNNILTFDSTDLNQMASLFFFKVAQSDPTATPQNQLYLNTYTQCNQVSKGAIFRISNGSQVYDLQSSYVSNSALYGGVAYAENANSLAVFDTPTTISKSIAFYGGFVYLLQSANSTITNAIFLQCSASEGAVAYMLDRSYLDLEVYTIQSSVAYRRGMISAMSGSWFTLIQGTVQLNTAYYDSAFIFMMDSTDIVTYSSSQLTFLNRFTSSIRFTNIYKNEVLYGGKLISVIGGNLVIQQCQINKNYIYDDTEGIYAISANVWVNNTAFSENYQTSYYTVLANQQLGDMNGAYMSIGQNSTVFINQSTFTNGRAVYGGCIAIQGTSQTYISGSTFSGCSALLGGGIYASNIKSLTIESSTFVNNIAFRGYGVNVYVMISKLNLTLNSNTFQSYHNSVFLRDGVLLSMNNNAFTYQSNRAAQIPLIEYAGGLHIINTLYIQLSGYNNFTGLKGKNGGAIYIYLDLNYKNLYSGVSSTFDGLYITGCSASVDGGAIYAQNIKQMTISNSKISKNTAANGNGGAIQFICYQLTSDVCNLNIKTSAITSNSAQIGGGVRWNWVAPVVDSLSTISGNIGSLYGQDYASFARQLVLIDDSDTYLKYFNKSSIDKISVGKTLTAYTYTNVQSGGYIPTQYMALVDDQGQVVSINSGGMIKFQVTQITINNFTTAMSGVNEFFSAYGVYNVSGLLIVAAPNSTQTLTLTVVDAVDLTKPSNQNFLKSAYGVSGNLSTYQIGVTLIIRGCIKGEGLTDNGACFTCAKGTYLLVAPTTPTDCKVCPAQKAICNGGSNIGPQAGYWRKNNQTDNFIACFVATSCLGMIEPDLNPVGDCAEQYYGALCTACMPGYSRSGDYACNKCPAPFLNVLRIAGIMVAVVIVLVIMVRSTINSATKKSGYSVFTKILTNHLQLLSICSSFKFQWPSFVTSFFSGGSFISSSQQSLVSFDCQMDTRTTASIQRYVFTNYPGQITVLYEKMMIYAGMPILICIIVVITWLIILKRQNKMDQLETRFLASVVIIFFLVHPTITQQMINLFNCQEFDGDLRLMSDLQVICYTDLHVYMAYFLALPAIGLWGIGIPAAVWYLMNKDKEKLDTLAVKQKFGFLYNGYKRTNFFWEIVIMYRKIVLIGLSVFLNRIGTIVQALVLLILLVLFLQFNNMRRPFANRSLNDIEDISLFAGIITIYCAIFFISSRDPTSASYNPSTDFSLSDMGKLILFVLIMAFNIAFFVTWFFKFIAVVRLMIKEKQPKLYVAVFLCCRQDKLEGENEQLAKITKRETIIEKIEEIQFFLKNMKGMYTRQIFYEGHQQFLKMLYFIETEKAVIDMTEKKHNFYIQGKMARDRKFDPERMAEVLDQRILSIESDKFFGNGQGFRPHDSSKQILTQLVSEFDDQNISQKKISGQARREEFKKKATVISGLMDINKARGSLEDGSGSPQSNYSNLNNGEHLPTGIPRPYIHRDLKSTSQIKFYQQQQDLDETNNMFENSHYGLDETQFMNESQRGLLRVNNPKFTNAIRQNYIYNGSSGSNQNLKGFISGSGIIIDDGNSSIVGNLNQQNPYAQQRNSSQLNFLNNLSNSMIGGSGVASASGIQQEVLNTEERIKAYKKKSQQPLEDRLQRSRNATHQLNKGKKHKIEVEDVEGQSHASKDQEQNQNFAKDGLEQDYKGEMNLFTDMDMHKMEHFYFNRGRQGLFDTDYLYEDDSAREKRLMRGLTKRLADGNTKANKQGPKSQKSLRKSMPKQKRKQSIRKSNIDEEGGQESKANSKNQIVKSRRSSIASGGGDRARDELKIDFLPAPVDMKSYNKRGILQTNTKNNGETNAGGTMNNQQILEQASSLLKSMSHAEKTYTVEEILKQTKMGRKWREDLEYQHRLRAPDAVVREIMLDNITQQLQVRDYKHETAEKEILKNVLANDISMMMLHHGHVAVHEDHPQNKNQKQNHNKNNKSPENDKQKHDEHEKSSHHQGTSGHGDFSNKINALRNANQIVNSKKQIKLLPLQESPTKHQHTPQNKIIHTQHPQNTEHEEHKEGRGKKRRGTVRGTIVTIKEEPGLSGNDKMMEDRHTQLVQELKQRLDDHELIITLDTE